MNRVVTTDASITAGQPIVANAGLGTLPFIQDSFQEAMSNLIKGIINVYTTNDLIVFIDPLIVISGGGNTATWTAGAIFYNGEVYTIPAGTLTKVSGVFIYVITDVQSPVLDPVKYKDNSTHSPHRVRQITISSGTTGTGIADYGGATVKNLNGSWVNIPLAAAFVATSNGAVYRKYPDNIVRLRGDVVWNSGASGIIGTMPTGLRPLRSTTWVCWGNDGSGIDFGPLGLNINTSGAISIAPINGGSLTFGATLAILLGNVSYPID